MSDARPADCDCRPTFEGLCCFACWKAGFEDPNPDADAGDETPADPEAGFRADRRRRREYRQAARDGRLWK